MAENNKTMQDVEDEKVLTVNEQSDDEEQETDQPLSNEQLVELVIEDPNAVVSNSFLCSGFLLTKKVTPIIGVYPSANFPQEKYFSPSNQFFPNESNFSTFIQSNVRRFSE